MKKITKTFLTIIASVFVAMQMGALPISAQTGSGLQVRPPRQELTVERGSSDVFEVTLVNKSDQPVVAKAFVNDFEADGVSGEPKIIADSTIRTERSIAEFLDNVEDINLAGNEEKRVTISVSVPESAPAGAYYGLLRYQTAPTVDGQTPADVQFSLNGSIGVLVLLEVPGDFTQSAEVDSIKAQTVDYDDDGNTVGDPKSGSFFTKAPQQLAIEVKNTGQSFVKPFGKVVVKNMLGNEVANYELNQVEPKGNVLPDTNRTFTDKISIGGLGRYTVEASVAFVQGGEVTTYNQTFWVIPVWLIIVLVAFVLMLGATGYMIFRKFSK